MKRRAIAILVVLAMAFPLNCLAENKVNIYHNVPEVVTLLDLPFVAEFEIVGKKAAYMAIQREGKPDITFFATGEISETFSVPLDFRGRQNTRDSMLVVAADQMGNIITEGAEITLDTDCPGCDLSCKEPSSTGWYRCPTFYKIDFSYANLSGASFRGQHLCEGLFSYANLIGVDFSSDLHSAKVFTCLHRSKFIGADLLHADFTGTQVANAEWDNARCPDGSFAADHGQTCIGHGVSDQEY